MVVESNNDNNNNNNNQQQQQQQQQPIVSSSSRSKLNLYSSTSNLLTHSVNNNNKSSHGQYNGTTSTSSNGPGGSGGMTKSGPLAKSRIILPVDERKARCQNLLREDDEDEIDHNDHVVGAGGAGAGGEVNGLHTNEDNSFSTNPINSFDSEESDAGGSMSDRNNKRLIYPDNDIDNIEEGGVEGGGIQLKPIKKNDADDDEVDEDDDDDEDDESDIDIEDQLDAEYLQNEENQEMERLARLRKYHHIYREADFWLEHINILLSVVSVGLFIAMSYVDVDGKTWYDLNFIIFGLSLYFVFDFVRLLVFTNDRLHFITKRETIIDLVSLLPIFVTLLPNSIVNVIPLAFLRVLRILKAPRLFKLYGANTVTQKTAQLILSILIIILLFASMFTSVEGVPFHTSLYFAVVTLSTVGYGDVTPQSIVGRMLTITMIILTLIYLPLVTSELLQNLSNNRPWHRSFKTKKQFIAIVGNITEKSLSLFSKEYFFSTRITKQTPLLVFNSEEPPSYINQLKAKFKISKYLIYIKGSSGLQEDISRSGIKNSRGIFLFSKQSPKDSKDDDEENLLRVMALRSFIPKVPIYVQIMTPRYRQKFLDAGASQVINIQELKLNILAQSCLSPGFSTFMMNLFRSDGNIKKEFTTITDGYKAGKMHEIFSCRFSSAFEGMTFKEASKLIFEKLGMIVIGVEMIVQKKPKMKLIPTKDYIIKETDSAILLAKNKTASRRVRICTKEFLQQPSSLYPQTPQEDQAINNFNMDSKVFWTYEPVSKRYICQLKLTPRKTNENSKKHRKTLHKLIIEKKQELNIMMSVNQTIQGGSAHNSLTLPTPPSTTNSIPLSQLFSNPPGGSPNSSPVSSTPPSPSAGYHHKRALSNDNQNNSLHPPPSKQQEVHQQQPPHTFDEVMNQLHNNINNSNTNQLISINNNNNNGIVGETDSTTSTSPLINNNGIINDIHSTMTIPQPPPPPPPLVNGAKLKVKTKRFWITHSLQDQLVLSVEDMNNIDNHIILAGYPTNVEFFIRPLREDYLRRYDPIVLLTPIPITEEDWFKICRYPDVYVVVGRPSSVTDVKRAGISKCSKFVVLKGEGSTSESIISDKETLITVLGIKPLIQNNLIFTIFELTELSNMRFLVGNEKWNQNDPYYVAPSFASGGVFLSETFDSLLGQCYYNPHMLTLVESLVGKSTVDSAGNRTKICQVDVPDMFVDQRFGYLFECLVDCNIFCLGLYRYDNSISNHYVHTNPAPSTIISRDDKLFILLRMQ